MGSLWRRVQEREEGTEVCGTAVEGSVTSLLHILSDKPSCQSSPGSRPDRWGRVLNPQEAPPGGLRQQFYEPFLSFFVLTAKLSK
jgi:hypothetical protein